ncbi:MAG: molybdopterin-binding protein [Akkermansia sp.]|nr:molybdopterin-binding protein [Clostridia bacterium]MBP3499002.1 molybdopterin-binding protein [Akkermansia sp.]
MKKISVENAVGMELCHDITEMKDGFKGAAFRRGHIIREEDIPHLLNLGKKSVFIWEENAGEIHEEDCARRMAAMASVQGAHYTEPSEGKVLLLADERGMFRVNRELLRRINSIGDITITTLPDHYPVEKGARLASMRIVPLVTREEQIMAAEKMCSGERLLELRPYRPRRIGVIITGSEVYSGRIKDKFEPVVRRKMENYPAEIVGITICDDQLDMIVDAAKTHLEKGADFLIFTGGMSVDPDDLTPSAIRKLGAEIVTHGVPAQPGNMTLVAYLGDVPILGVPGAAISLPTTIFDVLLPQVFAGDRITKEELIALGDGGLCQMCANCRWPNCSFGRY